VRIGLTSHKIHIIYKTNNWKFYYNNSINNTKIVIYKREEWETNKKTTIAQLNKERNINM
jgi:hypothetical protein